jgi:hypothetical protein
MSLMILLMEAFLLQLKPPVIANPMPAALATQMPLDQIFSPKIIPANRPIQSRFIHPRATIRRKYAQQQPRQYMP